MTNKDIKRFEQFMKTRGIFGIFRALYSINANKSYKTYIKDVAPHRALENAFVFNEMSGKSIITPQEWFDFNKEWQNECINNCTTIKEGTISDLKLGNSKLHPYLNEHDIKQLCIEVSKKYKTIKDFKENSLSYYERAVKNGWIGEFTWLERGKTYSYWTKDRCFEEAQKYKTMKDFMEGNQVVFNKATRFGWIKDYNWLRVYTGDDKKQEAEVQCEEPIHYDREFEFIDFNKKTYVRLDKNEFTLNFNSNYISFSNYVSNEIINSGLTTVRIVKSKKTGDHFFIFSNMEEGIRFKIDKKRIVRLYCAGMARYLADCAGVKEGIVKIQISNNLANEGRFLNYKIIFNKK